MKLNLLFVHQLASGKTQSYNMIYTIYTTSAIQVLDNINVH